MSEVVLAYSGGLDTSVCIPLLRERYGFDKIVTVLVDVGQPHSDIERGNLRAKQLADEHYMIDARKEFVKTICSRSSKQTALMKDMCWERP